MTDDDKELQAIEAMQIAAVRACSKITNDPALTSYALMRLAILLAIAGRNPDQTKLEHLDWLMDSTRRMHERVWDSDNARAVLDTWQAQARSTKQ